MKKEDYLYFEKDDASQMGINGKQVFVAKRINGKSSHNKKNKESIGIKGEKTGLDDNEIIIGINKSYDKKVEETKVNKKRKSKLKKAKNKKTKKNNKIIAKFFGVFMLIIGVGVVALISPIFNIEKITVNGNTNINYSTIVSLSGLVKGENIFRFWIPNIKENIKENPYIDKVKIKRVLPNNIEISVIERKVAYQLKVIDSYIYIDYQGYILEKSNTSMNVPLLEGLKTTNDELLNKKRITEEDIYKLNDILKIIQIAKSSDIYDEITKIRIENSKEYVLELKKEQKLVYIGDIKDIANKMLYTKTILEKEEGNSGKIYVNGNVNNGFKPFFREEKIGE